MDFGLSGPEQAFADEGVCRDTARVFCDELVRHGTTTALVFCSVHADSVDALFTEAERRNLRLIAGKVLMNRNAQPALLDTARSGYDQSKALIGKWHGRRRCLYAITPRAAMCCTPEQLEAAGALWREHPDVFVQTHISENRDEIAWVKELFPQRRDYLDVYAHYGLIGRRAVLAHGVHLEEGDFEHCHASGTALAFSQLGEDECFPDGAPPATQSRQAHSTMRRMKASQASICEARRYSLGWCAWAMSPGPQTTVGTPSVLRKMPASVP